MVANAGIAQVKALLDLTEQDLKRMFEVNGKAFQLPSSDVGLRSGQSTACIIATQLPQSK